MAGWNSHITILTLNVNELNVPVKKHRLTNWIESRPTGVLNSEDPFHVQRQHRLKIKRWSKTYQANGKKKKAGITILDFDE